MVVYFLTKQPELCSLIADQLKKSFHICSIFTDSAELYGAVTQNGSGKIDLIALDYSLFEHDIFNPFEILLHDEKSIIPVIYYNDPYPESSEMAAYWKAKNRSCYGEKLPEEKLHQIYPLFKQLQNIVNSERINPYISVICKPRTFILKNSFISRQKFSPEQYRLQKNMPQSRYDLFMLFYRNKDIPLTSSWLCEQMWNENSLARQNALYSYIHDLRKFFSSDETKLFSIERQENSCYVFRSILQKGTADEYFNREESRKVLFSVTNG